MWYAGVGQPLSLMNLVLMTQRVISVYSTCACHLLALVSSVQCIALSDCRGLQEPELTSIHIYANFVLLVHENKCIFNYVVPFGQQNFLQCHVNQIGCAQSIYIT